MTFKSLLDRLACHEDRIKEQIASVTVSFEAQQQSAGVKLESLYSTVDELRGSLADEGRERSAGDEVAQAAVAALEKRLEEHVADLTTNLQVETSNRKEHLDRRHCEIAAKLNMITDSLDVLENQHETPFFNGYLCASFDENTRYVSFTPEIRYATRHFGIGAWEFQDKPTAEVANKPLAHQVLSDIAGFLRRLKDGATARLVYAPMGRQQAEPYSLEHENWLRRLANGRLELLIDTLIQFGARREQITPELGESNPHGANFSVTLHWDSMKRLTL